MKKGNELNQRCQADVYILLRYRGRYYACTSTEQLSWPPNPNDIVSSFSTALLRRLLKLLLKAKSYPLPVMKTLAHFTQAIEEGQKDTEHNTVARE